MSKLTEEELALLTDEEREGYLADEDDDEGEEGNDDQGNDDEGADPADKGNVAKGDDDGEGDDDPQDDPTLAVDDPAAAAQAAANAQEGGEGGDQGDGAQPQEQFTPQPKPLFSAELPADIKAQRTAIDAKEDALDKQFDEGDITFSEHKKALRELNQQRNSLDRAELKAELSAEAYQTQIDNSWQASQTAFFSAHPEINTANDAQMAALDHLVRQETKAVLDKGGAIGVPELERAYAKFKQAFNIADPAPKQEKQQQQKQVKPKKENIVPPNLGTLPAATANDTDDGKFAALDRLEGTAYEDALAKLTDAQRDEYLRSA